MISTKRLLFLLLILVFQIETSFGLTQVDNLDFSNASIVNATASTAVELTAIEMLVEEIQARSGLELEVNQSGSKSSLDQIVVATFASLQRDKNWKTLLSSANSNKKDGFQISIVERANQKILLIAGQDARGLLYGVGYFLRKSLFSKNKIMVPADIDIITHPQTPLRGHQLGYRPKVNSYDGFTVAMWEKYIRDLVVFGTNAVELMPPFTDDAKDSPMFTLPQKDMLVEMSSLLKKYGMDVWIWYPLMHGDYTDQKVVEASLSENEELFKSMPKLDAVFVPGGDPGKQEPKVLFQHMAREWKVLTKYHPEAKIWVSPQGYSAAWMEEFKELLQTNPPWLGGVVHGPWVRMDVNDLRKVVPAKYPIRRYPDITHSIDGQYFVPSWDFAYTVTQNRETINPRPMDQAKVYRAVKDESSIGFISYSEGVNDDVNKIIWSGLGWDREADVMEILRDYGRYYIGANYADDFAQGLLNLEKNWQGNLINNALVPVHHAIWAEMERKASPQVRLNWRFQSALYRSYYDVYNYDRLLYERQLENSALGLLRQSSKIGSLRAIHKAREVLALATEDRQSDDYRQRIFELAEALFQSIRMQLSVEKYFARATIRGGNLDLVDSPLNNRYWLEDQFDRIALLDGETDRVKELNKLVDWKNPGPGGYYDDLGDLDNQPHFIYDLDYEKDPNSFQSAFIGLPGGYSLEMDRIQKWRVSWKTYMQTIYEIPLRMKYENLDPTAEYEIKVTYVEDQPLRLMAGEGVVVHDYLIPSESPEPMLFAIPASAIQDGRLEIQWEIKPGGKGPGRGCSVAEVWLIKK